MEIGGWCWASSHGWECCSAGAHALTKRFTHWIGGAALAGGALLFPAQESYWLAGVMLIWPLLDRDWQAPAVARNPKNIIAWSIMALAMAGLLIWQPRYAGFAVSALLLAALPEEWFFRAYFMMRLGAGWRANIITSLLFALLHGLVWGWMTALQVFLPSLFYGWLYQRTRDIILLILLHTLSNLFFVLFLADSLATWLKSSPV